MYVHIKLIYFYESNMLKESWKQFQMVSNLDTHCIIWIKITFAENKHDDSNGMLSFIVNNKPCIKEADIE